jgi:putative ABC transport system substrate-binding protein
MRRREFLGGLTAGAASLVTWPLVARAQRPTLPVIGRLSTATVDQSERSNHAFLQGLGETGHVAGQNVLIEYRGADGRYERLPELANELVRREVSVMVTGGIPATMAAKASGTAIPVVFYMGGDPIELGLVASLNRPGGNFTGATVLNTELVPKRLELLHELVPAAESFAVLVNPANRNAEPQWRDMQAAARALKLQLHLLRAGSEHEFDAVFANAKQLRAGGLVIAADGIFVSLSERLAALSVRHGVPTIFQFPDFVAAGGLISYGGSQFDAYRQVGVYAGRILKGEKPADLPVQQSTKVEMIINLKTAKTLGIAIPLPLLGRADEVIE